MTTSRAILAAILLALPAVLHAEEEFDPAEFFGAEYFTPSEDEPARGNLHAELTGKVPGWIELNGAGAGPAGARVVVTDDGLRVEPDDRHPSVELRMDAGASALDAKFILHELETGGSIAWHVRGRREGGDYLVELKSREDGSYLLRVRVRTTARYVAVADATVEISELSLPTEFRLRMADDRMIAHVGGNRTETPVDFKDGIGIGIAVSDEAAVLRDLRMDVHLHPEWIADAATRLAARKALARLREMATLGLLGGVRAYGYPGAAEALEAYGDDDRRARATARGADTYVAADKLIELAEAMPQVAMAQHEAGVAALVAGRPATARAYLKKANGLNPVPVTHLALAEACRRTGDVDAAERALASAGEGLPDELAPDHALIEGRLLADRGQTKRASELLDAAAEAHPGHAALKSFAESAAALTNPERLSEIDLKAPLGLRLVSDIDAARLEPLLDRLVPYMKQLREWLPGLELPLDGTIGIFSSPVDYLRAALLVAGDNIDHVAGMYLRHGIGDGPTVMACRGFGEDELVRTLVHEIWHLALASTGRDVEIPRWLNEGMAVYLSAGRLEDGRIHWNALPAEFAEREEAPGILDAEVLARCVEARPHTFYIPGEVRENYFAAWSLVWYYATTDILRVDLKSMLAGDTDAISGAIRGDDMADRINASLRERLQE